MIKERHFMKRLLLILSFVFVVLTFVGVISVLSSHGTVSAGYAVIPMVIALACLSGFRAYTKK